MQRYYVGTSGWHYDHWRERFYPPDLPRDKWLGFYAGHLSTVELNNSFYRLPSENAFTRWRDSTPPGFLFAVKVSRFVTHIKRLKDIGAAMESFLARARLLGDKLGPLLYQTPPSMPRDDATLEAFLSQLPRSFQHVFEFRHQSWLEQDVFRLLRRYNAGLCVFDMPGQTCPLVATADYAYFRFHGSTGLYWSSYSDQELGQWATRIKGLEGEVERVYIYFNNDAGAAAVGNARTLAGLLGGRTPLHGRTL